MQEQNSSSSSVLQDTDYAWLAGLVDGDGCFTYGTANGGLYMYLRIVNTHQETAHYLVDKFDAYISTQQGPSGHKLAYHLTFSASKLRPMLPYLNRYLITKREQALIATKFLSMTTWTAETREARKLKQQELIGQLRELNRKGKK